MLCRSTRFQLVSWLRLGMSELRDSSIPSACGKQVLQAQARGSARGFECMAEGAESGSWVASAGGVDSIRCRQWI